MAKFIKFIKNSGKIKLVSGMCIAGGDVLDIGGADTICIKSPLTGLPYIPGSSLKGAMRSNLEMDMDLDKTNRGNPCGCGRKECMVCTLFGAYRNPKAACGNGRMTVKDSYINKEFLESLGDKKIIELKTENSVSRGNGPANPRMIERVAAGTEFDYEIVIKIFEGDDENKFKSNIEKAMKRVSETGIGGSKSRGYGQCEFVDSHWEDLNI